MTQQVPPLVPLMTVREVAEYFRVCTETVRDWVHAGKLKPVGHTPGGPRFDRAAIDAFLRQRLHRRLDPNSEELLRAALQAKGLSQDDIEREILRERSTRTKRERERERKTMSEPGEASRRYWSDPENRRRQSEAMRLRHAERRARLKPS
jgi:excisionase family DNA binding protein